MRLRTIHPQYLDSKWLVALWREWLLARKCLQAYRNYQKIWYGNHSQLIRFKKLVFSCVDVMDSYLCEVFEESVDRNYAFDGSKINTLFSGHPTKIPVTEGQVLYEIQHLLKKLKERDIIKQDQLKDGYENLPLEDIIHPQFFIVKWDVEEWEVIS